MPVGVPQARPRPDAERPRVAGGLAPPYFPGPAPGHTGFLRSGGCLVAARPSRPVLRPRKASSPVWSPTSPFPRRIAVAPPSGLPCGRPSSRSRFLSSHPPCGWRFVQFAFRRNRPPCERQLLRPVPLPFRPPLRATFPSERPCPFELPLRDPLPSAPAPVFRRFLAVGLPSGARRLRPWRCTLFIRTSAASTGLEQIRKLSTANPHLSTGRADYPPLVPSLVHKGGLDGA